MCQINNNRLPWYLTGLLISVLLVYFNSYNADFIGDDYAVILDNSENFDNPSIIFSYFTNGVWNHTNVGIQDHNLYRPVWLLWEYSVYQIAGEQPFIWHLSNLLLHALNGMLLFYLAGMLFPASSHIARFITALFFVVYTAASHSVMWISGSADLFLALFFFISMIAYIKFKRGDGTHWYFFSMLAFAGALFTKETGICLLLLLILIDRDREAIWQKLAWKEYMGFIVLAITYLLIRKTVLQHVSGVENDWQLDFEGTSRLFEYGATYLKTLFLPWPLPTTLRHPPNGVAGLFDPYIGGFILLVLGYLFVRFRTSRVSIGLILFPISIPLLLALHKNGLFAVRILYVPVSGMALLLLPLIERAYRTKIWRAIIVIYLVCLSALTVTETYNWTDKLRWGKHLVRFDPGNSAGWIEQAEYYKKKGVIDDAVITYRHAMNKVSDRNEWLKLARPLALLFAEEKRYPESLAVYTEMTKTNESGHFGWTGMGNNLWMLGRLEEAADAYSKALEIKPDYFDALYNYGLVNAQTGNLDIAISTYQNLINLPVKADKLNELKQAKNYLRLWKNKQDK